MFSLLVLDSINIITVIGGMVRLLFDLILSPSKSFNHLVRLVVTSPHGGVWKYPLRFKADKPEADDVIVIKSVGLNKESLISFRINSQSESSTQFEAHFANGSDSMFTVRPSSGTLATAEEGGTLITISYTPLYYGKVKFFIHSLVKHLIPFYDDWHKT